MLIDIPAAVGWAASSLSSPLCGGKVVQGRAVPYLHVAPRSKSITEGKASEHQYSHRMICHVSASVTGAATTPILTARAFPKCKRGWGDERLFFRTPSRVYLGTPSFENPEPVNKSTTFITLDYHHHRKGLPSTHRLASTRLHVCFRFGSNIRSDAQSR